MGFSIELRQSWLRSCFRFDKSCLRPMRRRGVSCLPTGYSYNSFYSDGRCMQDIRRVRLRYAFGTAASRARVVYGEQNVYAVGSDNWACHVTYRTVCKRRGKSPWLKQKRTHFEAGLGGGNFIRLVAFSWECDSGVLGVSLVWFSDVRVFSSCHIPSPIKLWEAMGQGWFGGVFVLGAFVSFFFLCSEEWFVLCACCCAVDNSYTKPRMLPLTFLRDCHVIRSSAKWSVPRLPLSFVRGEGRRPDSSSFKCCVGCLLRSRSENYGMGDRYHTLSVLLRSSPRPLFSVRTPDPARLVRCDRPRVELYLRAFLLASPPCGRNISPVLATAVLGCGLCRLANGLTLSFLWSVARIRRSITGGSRIIGLLDERPSHHCCRGLFTESIAEMYGRSIALRS